MCDINEKTNFKTKTVYKVVTKSYGRYCSPIARTVLRKGAVSIENKTKHIADWAINVNMIGKVSGFDSKKDALLFADDFLIPNQRIPIILKIKLGGIILKGTSKGICHVVPHDSPTYAGTKILKMEEVKK